MGRMENVHYFAAKGGWDDDTVTIQSNPVHNEEVFPVSVEGSKGWQDITYVVGENLLDVFQQVLHILVTARGLPHHVLSNRVKGGQVRRCKCPR